MGHVEGVKNTVNDKSVIKIRQEDDLYRNYMKSGCGHGLCEALVLHESIAISVDISISYHDTCKSSKMDKRVL